MGRSGVAPDEVGDLLRAAGRGAGAAFAALSDRTASGVFGLLQPTLGESAAERAAVRVYVQVWRTAAAFDPAVMSGGAFLLKAVYREFDERKGRDHGAGSWISARGACAGGRGTVTRRPRR